MLRPRPSQRPVVRSAVVGRLDTRHNVHMTCLFEAAATARADYIKVKLDEALDQLETAHPRHLPVIAVVPDRPYPSFAVADTGEHEVLGPLRVGGEAGLPRMKHF